MIMIISNLDSEMWVLDDIGNGAKYVLPCNHTVAIGRKEVDIVIHGDSSVSRKHATIHITYALTDLARSDGIGKVVLTDSSKFGTYVTRGQCGKVKVEKCLNLEDGDSIEFGVQGSIFKLSKKRFNATTSMLSDEQKLELQRSMLVIGGNMINAWHDNIDYLVVQAVKLSIKVVKALATPCHIVSTDFIINVKNQILTKLGEVRFDPERFLPVINEPTLLTNNCSFHRNEERKKLFVNKNFIFFTQRQHKHMGPVVTAAGGQVHLAVVSALCHMIDSQPGACFVNTKKSSTESLVVPSTAFIEIRDKLKVADRRMIEEHEIGLAILYCDSSVYCNPTVDLNSENAFTQKTELETYHTKKNLRTQPFEDDCGGMITNTKDVGDHKESNYEHQSAYSSGVVSNSETLVKEDAGNSKNSLMDRRDDSSQNGISSYSMDFSPTLLQKKAGDICVASPPKNEIKENVNAGEMDFHDVDDKKYSGIPSPPTKTEALCTVKYSSLFHGGKRTHTPIKDTSTGDRNLKRFRKIWPTYMDALVPHQSSIKSSHKLPKIIGGSDFFVSGDSGENDFISQEVTTDLYVHDSSPFQRYISDA